MNLFTITIQILFHNEACVTLLYPTFRKDLIITSQLGPNGKLSFLVQNPKSYEIYEFSHEDYFICQQLNGKIPLQSVQVAFQQHFNVTIKLDQLESFIRHLNAIDLLEGEFNPPRILWHPETYFYNLPIGVPDRIVTFLSKCFGWCFTKTFMWLFCGILAFALFIAVKYFDTYIGQTRVLLDPFPFFLETAIGLLVIYVSGELGKAIACKLYYGKVPESHFGIVYRIVPHFYFDLTEPLWFLKKSERMKIFFAGLAAQLLLLAGGIIVWKNVPYGSGAHVFWVAFVMAALFFFLLNAIPFIPRDGYYLLITWLEKTDFLRRARFYFLSWLWRRPAPEPLSAREQIEFKWYGGLSLLYEVLFWLVLLLLYGYLLIWRWNLMGVGACLFLILMAFIFEDYLKRQFMRTPMLRAMFVNESGKIKVKLAAKLGLLAVFIIAMLIPYPFEAGGNFKLLPTKQVSIRAVVPGEIEKILVKEGQLVEKGQPLAVLLDKDQRARFEEAKESLQEAKERLALLKVWTET